MTVENENDLNNEKDNVLGTKIDDTEVAAEWGNLINVPQTPALTNYTCQSNDIKRVFSGKIHQSQGTVSHSIRPY